VVKIGALELSSPFVLASMSEISTPPARLLARQYGSAMAWTPMISAAHLRGGDDAETEKLAEIIPGEEPVGLQLVGSDEEDLAASVARAVDLGFQAVDLNSSCPVRRIRARGAGSALMKDPAKLAGCVAALRRSTKLPLTVKLRLGETRETMNYAECAAAAVDAGADAITLHGRAVDDSYLVGAHWEHIWRLAAECDLGVPVGGSGSVWTAEDAVRLLAESKCDYVALGRGATGNPWIFTEAEALLAGREKPAPPTPQELAETMRRHFEMLADRQGEATACRLMRSIGPAYLERLEGAEVAVATMRGVDTADAFDAICSLVALAGTATEDDTEGEGGAD